MTDFKRKTVLVFVAFFLVISSLGPAGAMPTHVNVIPDGSGGALLNSPIKVFVSGNYAYVVSQGSDSLEIIDISNPGWPRHAGSITNGAGGALLKRPLDVFVSGKYAYIASHESDALEIVDVSDPASPKHKGSIIIGAIDNWFNPGPVGPISVYVSGNYAYVPCAYSGMMEIVDISDPANPVRKSAVGDGSYQAKLAGPTSVWVSGNYAYVTSFSWGALEIVNVSRPAGPLPEGRISDGEGGALLNTPAEVVVAGNYAYVASQRSNALEIVDVSDPASPKHKGSITDGEGGARLRAPTGVAVSGNYAYIASKESNALEVVNISDPAAPRHAGSMVHMEGLGLDFPTGVAVSGNYAYVASKNSNALQIVDISQPEGDPRQPDFVTSLIAFGVLVIVGYVVLPFAANRVIRVFALRSVKKNPPVDLDPVLMNEFACSVMLQHREEIKVIKRSQIFVRFWYAAGIVALTNKRIIFTIAPGIFRAGAVYEIPLPAITRIELSTREGGTFSREITLDYDTTRIRFAIDAPFWEQLSDETDVTGAFFARLKEKLPCCIADQKDVVI
ncbi:hypothetical protein [Methanoregula sp.]|uniref:hypothetical protein n=1 Tax=Methanoregula sp. TaxID=2052170 RepID=UPI002633290D|nr:hypothetical protein [Methanoregula sp.]MDD5143118.1 hypothetical protein [Methanoregula sp.]